MNTRLEKTVFESTDEIAKIYLEEFSKPPYNEKWTLTEAIFKINDYYTNGDLYSVFNEDNLVGFIAINPNFMKPGEVALVEEMAVKEECRGEGVGSFIWQEIIKIYRARGFKRILGISNKDSRAYSFHEKNGILKSETDVLIEKVL